MKATKALGWKRLLAGYPWFEGEGNFPLPAYSEFMPPPRVGQMPYGEIDPLLFAQDDPYGWHVAESEQLWELAPGFQDAAAQIMEHLVKLGRGLPGHHLGGYKGRNFIDNPYWPRELAEHAGHLDHERYVVLLPVALSRTQDDMGRVRWTLFGSSEQGPEAAFWNSFYSAPGKERPASESLALIRQVLSRAYGVQADDEQLVKAGFRILPSGENPRFPYWNVDPLPSWTRPLVVQDEAPFDDVRYLLTFRPFDRLPAAVKKHYLAGRLHLLPFPGSLVFWGIPTYWQLQQQLPFAMQVPLLRLVTRHGGPDGLRVPQSGWLREPRRDHCDSEIQAELLLNTYRRTNRWNRVQRYEDAVAQSTHVAKMAQVLFSTALDAIDLYDKPMARNCQLWSEEAKLLLDGPNANRKEIEQAAASLTEGGLYRYRFQFPAMRIGLYEVYWQRPLVAYLAHHDGRVETSAEMPLGYLTAYLASPEALDLAHPVTLWPRLLDRPDHLSALKEFETPHDYYAHQTARNILALLDSRQQTGEQPLPQGFARQLLRTAKDESFAEWSGTLVQHAVQPEAGRHMQQTVQSIVRADPPLPEPLTFATTASRAYEQAYWQDIVTLSHGRYVTKDNADVVDDPPTLSRVQHHRRDLEQLGDYLIERHEHAIAAAGMEGRALVGDLPFRWRTDFDFPAFGGWKINQEGHERERNILVVIPGKNRREAVVLADHYDTAYMEDVYEVARGGSGARLAAAGADDDHSATAALLQAAPIFLKMAHDGRLERDVWLLHLTGEEFPSDCLGARYFCQALVEKTLKLRTGADKQAVDLSAVRVAGVFVMDMIAHNRDSAQDIFQIAPGASRASLQLAYQAHLANAIWNDKTREWNKSPERKGRGRRSADGVTIPEVASFPQLSGEVRMSEDPQSSLYNTDGQIFSDVGVPVVLFMENYDINRAGYHDTKDTMENIDLDYGAALSAIAIEAAARVATLS